MAAAGWRPPPRFMVDGRIVEASLLRGTESTGLRGAVRGTTIASVFVPPALRPWLEASQTVGAAMTFPPESIPRLSSRRRSARLGRRRRATPRRARRRAALRAGTGVARRVAAAGSAIVDIFITVQPRAPLVSAGKGPVLFTFAEGEQRFFVERDLAREVADRRGRRARDRAPRVWITCTATPTARGHARAGRISRSQPTRLRDRGEDRESADRDRVGGRRRAPST